MAKKQQLKNTNILKIIISFLVSCLFIFYLVKNQPINYREFYNIYKSASIKDILLSFLIILLANIVRSIRFSFFLERKNIFDLYIFYINNVYNLMTASLPGGIGEMFSIMLFKKYINLSYGSSFSIILLSRLLDLISLSTILFIFSLFYNFKLRTITLIITILLILLASGLLIPSINRTIIQIIDLFLRPIKITLKFRNFLKQLEKGLSFVNTLTRYITAAFLSLTMMFLSILSVKIALNSIHLQLSIIKTAVCFGVYAILQIIPIHGIGGLGTQEAWWTLGLTSVGIPKATAIPTSFFLHGLFYIFIFIIATLFGFTIFKNNPVDRR